MNNIAFLDGYMCKEAEKAKGKDRPDLGTEEGKKGYYRTDKSTEPVKTKPKKTKAKAKTKAVKGAKGADEAFDILKMLKKNWKLAAGLGAVPIVGGAAYAATRD